ncbi:MAG: cytochrome c [Hyphomicrobiales bacterium]|nr:cytochrome c [Hyphomicrobiales bacterium]
MPPAKWFAVVVTVTGLVGTQALAAGDQAAGQKLAEEHCARCHDITADGAFKQYPPSFASIAAFRSNEQIYYRILYPPMHRSMPVFIEYILQPGNIQDLTAFIVSLEKK